MTDYKVVEPSKKMLVVALLDESGSMLDCKKETIDGLNEYVQTLRATQTDDGEIAMTLVKFSGNFGVKFVYSNKAVRDVPALDGDTYTPDGSTPLFDAIGRAVHDTRKAIANEAEKPRILMIVTTDGMNNASVEYTVGAVRALIAECEKDGWTFVFLGANQNAWDAGGQMGFAAANTATYSTKSTDKMFKSLAKATTRRYAARSAPLETAYFTAEEQSELAEDVDTKPGS